MNCLPEDARVWVSERNPKTSEEAGGLVDDYMQARETRKMEESPQTDGPPRMTLRRHRRSAPPPGNCPRCGLLGHWARDCPNNKNEENTETNMVRREVAIVCYNCKQKGHIAARCPSKASLYCDSDGIGEEASRSSDVYRSENVNGMPVEDILLDTGATRTLVREDLAPTRSRVDGKVTMRCAHGDSVTYPLAETHISLRVAGRELTLTAAVSKTLPAAVLLGRDAPELITLLGSREEKGTADPVGMDHVLAVTTRAQAAQRKQEGQRITEREIIKNSQALTPVKSSQWTRNARAGKTHTAPTPRKIPANLTLMILMRTREASALKKQKKIEQLTSDVPNRPKLYTMRELDFSADELKELQRTDSTLEAVRKSARGEPSTAGPGFFQRDGILYRRYVPRTGDTEHGVIEQLILPTPCRKAVLSLAHSIERSIPPAGHMGKNKTALRILQRFYWPSVFRDVAEYCKSCPGCQKSAPRRAPQAFLYSTSTYYCGALQSHCNGHRKAISTKPLR